MLNVSIGRRVAAVPLHFWGVSTQIYDRFIVNFYTPWNYEISGLSTHLNIHSLTSGVSVNLSSESKWKIMNKLGS